MRHKSVQLLSIGVLSAMLLVGCSSSNTSTTGTADTTAAPVTLSPDSTSSEPGESADAATYGQITSIDGSSIAVALGTKKEMNKDGKGQGGDKPDGIAPSRQPEQPNDSDGQTPPSDQPKVPTDSDAADGQKGEKFSMLDLTGETKTLTVNDSTTVTIQSRGESSAGFLSDLQVGDMISFELSSDDSTVTAITLQSMVQKGNGERADHKKQDTASPSASETPAS